MLNRSASLAMSTSVLKALPGKLDIKRHSPSILYSVFIVFLMLSGCYCSLPLPQGAMGWFAVCDCGLSGHTHFLT